MNRIAGFFFGSFLSHIMPGKAGDQLQEVVFQEKADET
jgi:hypothetical protein